MNLKKLAKEVSATYFKKGDLLLKKNAVRELEEEEKNKFIAFVDDGEASYDVMINIDKTFEILEHSCDCEEKYIFCEHKVAVALHLKDRGKSDDNSVAKKIRAKKIDENRNLINSIDEESLRDWLYDLSKANKEILHMIKAKFQKQDVILTRLTIETKSNEIVNAILGKAKYFDASKITKIINLWQPYHIAIIDELMSDYEQDKIELFEDLVTYIAAMNSRSKTNSQKLWKYIGLLYEKLSIKINDLPLSKKRNLIQYLSDKCLKKIYNPDLHKLVFTHIECLNEEDRKKNISNIIKVLNKYSSIPSLEEAMDQLESQGLLKDYISLFETQLDSTPYNIKLINKHIEYDFQSEAERRCMHAMKVLNNYEFKLPYAEVLKKLYLDTHDEEAYIEIVKEYLPYSLNFDDYVAFYNYEPGLADQDTVFNKVNKMLSKHDGKIEVGEFIFKVLNFQEKYSDMIEHISASYPVAFFYPYVEQIVASNKALLLEKLIHFRYANFTMRFVSQDDKKLYFDILDKYYTKKEIYELFTSRRVYSPMYESLQAYLRDYI